MTSDDPSAGGAELAARRRDDALRKDLFARLEAARRQDSESGALDAVVEALGPAPNWIRAFRRFSSQRLARLVLIVTWQCELRCAYCWIPKQNGRVMSKATIDSAIELLMSSVRDRVNLQFFGGEALLEFERVQHAIERAETRAAACGKDVDFVLSTNGFGLTENRIAWLARHPVKLELSLDGDRETQVTWRRSIIDNWDSYSRSIVSWQELIAASGLQHDVIMVVQPKTVSRLFDNFFHIVDLGFSRVQINFALGVPWSPSHAHVFAEQLMAIAEELDRRPGVVLVNEENAPVPIRLNGEVHVDWDGTVYNSNGFLNENEHKAEFAVGRLSDLAGFDRYWMDAPDNDFLLARTYPEDVTRNNLKMGQVLASFLRWRRRGRAA